MMQFLKYFLSFRFLYLLLGGVFFFLISITFTIIFIPRLDMPENWCKKWQTSNIGYRSQEECVEFSAEVDKLKYHHNQKMEKRLSGKTYGMFIAATLLTFLIMLLSPGKFIEHRITFENYSGAVAVAVFYGVIIGFLLPVLFEVILPPTETWLPEEFFEINKARVEWVEKQIMIELKASQ